ncbi:hypothetical protein [Sorangium sp. So ce513]|uniref:hypothetical protein n=1 Tax=Sorangium sp. So ce513 TaxID=3133315 RepID=UPI003F60734E
MTKPNLLDAFTIAAIFLMLTGCKGEEKACVPGSTQTCVCPGVQQGAQTCAADGARWESCVCVAPDPAALRRNKVSERNALVAVANNGVYSIEKGTKTGADQGGSGALRAMADAMDKVAADAALVKLTTPELKRFSSEYQAMAKDVAKAARDLAAAADANDAEKSNRAQAAIEKVIRQEDPTCRRS